MIWIKVSDIHYLRTYGDREKKWTLLHLKALIFKVSLIIVIICYFPCFKVMTSQILRMSLNIYLIRFMSRNIHYTTEPFEKFFIVLLPAGKTVCRFSVGQLKSQYLRISICSFSLLLPLSLSLSVCLSDCPSLLVYVCLLYLKRYVIHR